MQNHINIKGTILLSLTLVLLASYSVSDKEEKSKPNIIILLADDQGYGDLGITGNPVMETPNIDAMAKESAVMNNFYVSPVFVTRISD